MREDIMDYDGFVSFYDVCLIYGLETKEKIFVKKSPWLFDLLMF
jgi:hypothetical protein